MKCGFLRYLLVLFLVLSAASLSQAQTKADLQTQVNPPVVNDATVIMVLPGVGFVPVRLDANSIELVGTQQGLFLKSKAATPRFQEDFFKLTAPQTVFKTTQVVTGGKMNMVVYRNGLLQREVEDYNAAQENDGLWTITFKASVPTKDFVTIRYTVN